MGRSDRKLEISILGLSIALLGSLGFLLKAPEKTVLAIQNIVYEMPRPKNSFLASLFNLGDREISRRYDNPFAKKKMADQKTAEAPKAAATPAKAVAKKDDTKKSDDKNAQKNVDVQIVGDDPNVALGGDDILMPTTGAPRIRSVPTDSKAASSPDDNKKVTLSGAQWRSLILAQPSKENINKLVEAYNSGEVDDNTFFMIVSDFFRDNKVERQNIGLSIVKNVYNQKSFAIVASQYSDLAPEVQDKAHAYLLSFAVNSRFGILISSLQSNNTEVVTIAAQVVLSGYQKAKEGLNPVEDPRQSRGDGFTNSVAGYSKFLPIFQRLAQSQDSGIASLANTALSQIQVAVASL